MPSSRQPTRTQRQERARPEQFALETLELVTEQMGAAVTRCSRDFRYLWANQGCADLLHRRLDDIVGRRIVDVMGKEVFESLRHHFERVLGGEKVSYEQDVNYQGIGRRWISATYIPAVDGSGVVDGWVAVIIDITDRKLLEQKLHESQERLTAGIASAMGAIQGYMRDGKKDSQEMSHDGSIKSRCELLQSLTPRERQILEFLVSAASTRQVALSLNVSETTVRNHVQNLFSKLGVHSRLECVAVAHELGFARRGNSSAEGSIRPKLDASSGIV